MKKIFKKHKFKFLAAFIFALLCFALALMFYKQIIKLNTPSKEKFPVRGVDVSSYQGDIDWDILSKDIDFAYIKATEGSAHLDGCFDYNYAHAQNTHLRVGAYHFFSFDSSGDTQAANFISHVAPCTNMLPPVIDVELYGDYLTSPKAADDVVPQLRLIIEAIENYYGMKPVIYATGTAYNMYIKDNFPECGLWIRDVYFTPKNDFTFWQYSGTGRLDGYNGEEKYIDLNVFNGSLSDFENYPQP